MQRVLNAQTRIDLIEAVVDEFKYQSYLELGCQGDATFGRVKCPVKVGVDSLCGGSLRMTTDEYFKTHTDKFDACFIDAWHFHDQVLKDALHCVSRLNPGGMIFMHDCAPPNQAHEDQQACGTAWRAFLFLLCDPDLDMILADWDCGIGMVRVGKNQKQFVLGGSMDDLKWEDYEKYKADGTLRHANQARVAEWLVAGR